MKFDHIYTGWTTAQLTAEKARLAEKIKGSKVPRLVLVERLAEVRERLGEPAEAVPEKPVKADKPAEKPAEKPA